MFISKNPAKEKISDGSICQQRVNQLSLLQRTHPSFQQDKKIKGANTNPYRLSKKVKRSGDATKGLYNVKIEPFVFDNSEIQPILKKERLNI